MGICVTITLKALIEFQTNIASQTHTLSDIDIFISLFDRTCSGFTNLKSYIIITVV